MLIPKETYSTCDFSGWSGPPVPLYLPFSWMGKIYDFCLNHYLLPNVFPLRVDVFWLSSFLGKKSISCSTYMSVKVVPILNLKTIVGVLKFMTQTNAIDYWYEQENCLICMYLFYEVNYFHAHVNCVWNKVYNLDLVLLWYFVYLARL